MSTLFCPRRNERAMSSEKRTPFITMNEVANTDNAISKSTNSSSSSNNTDNKPINPRSRIFRPCLTCRRRKISCDKTRPKCKRCAQTGYPCEGYGEERHFVYVIPTRSATPPDASGSSRGNGNRKNSNSSDGSGIKGANSKKVTLRSSRHLPPDHSNHQLQPQPPQQHNLPQRQHQLQHLQQYQYRQLWRPQQAAQFHQQPSLSSIMTIDSSSANLSQIVSCFVDLYLPGRLAHPNANITAMTWLMDLPKWLGNWRTLDLALSALSIAYIGHTQGDPRFSQQGTQFYAQSLQHMRGQLMRNQIDEGMLAACVCLSMFEIFQTSKGPNGWMYHVKGVCRLLELRGPPSASSPLDMNLYRRIRAVALWDSYGSGKTSFLANPEWRGLSDTPYDLLLDILLRLTSLSSEADQIEILASTGDENGAIEAAQNLLWKCHALRDELVAWYANFQSRESNPLFTLEPEEQHPFLEPGSDLNSVFPSSVKFHSPYVAQMLLLYWYGEVVVHSAMSTAHRYLLATSSGAAPESSGTSPSASASPSTTISVTTDRMAEARQQMNIGEGETLANIETIGEYFAAKICQAMAGCGSSNQLQGYGFQIAIVPLWAAQQYYYLRSPRKYMWCRNVLTNFGRKGFLVAQELGTISLRQYPGRYVNSVVVEDITP